MTSKNNPYYPLSEVNDTIVYTQKRFIPRTPSNSPPRKRDVLNEGSDLNNMFKTFQNMNLYIDKYKSKKK